MDITIHPALLAQGDPDAALARGRDTVGFARRVDGTHDFRSDRD